MLVSPIFRDLPILLGRVRIPVRHPQPAKSQAGPEANAEDPAQPHVLTGMAGFSSGGSLMPRLIRQHRGRFPPYFIYRTDQRRERPRRKVVQQHGRKRAVVERKLDGDKTYVLW